MTKQTHPDFWARKPGREGQHPDGLLSRKLEAPFNLIVALLPGREDQHPGGLWNRKLGPLVPLLAALVPGHEGQHPGGLLSWECSLRSPGPRNFQFPVCGDVKSSSFLLQSLWGRHFPPRRATDEFDPSKCRQRQTLFGFLTSQFGLEVAFEWIFVDLCLAAISGNA